MIESCRNCKHATVSNYGKKWEVTAWYCVKKKTVEPAFFTIVCSEFEPYE